MHQACLLLGSNIDPERNIPGAVALLGERLVILRTSSVWESASVECCYPDYLDMAVLVSTSLEAEQLKQQVLRPLEARMGRVRTEDKNASRPIDFDIITIDGKLYDPILWQHSFRAVPVAELLPDLKSGTGESLAQAARRLAHEAPVRQKRNLTLSWR